MLCSPEWAKVWYPPLHTRSILRMLVGNANSPARPNFLPCGSPVWTLNQAWQLYEENKLIDLLDPTISWCNDSIEEAICVIEMALLCTHSRSTLRPTMTSVVSMLTGGSEVVIPKLSRFDARDYANLGFKFSGSGNNSTQDNSNLPSHTSHNSMTDSSSVSTLEPR